MAKRVIPPVKDKKARSCARARRRARKPCNPTTNDPATIAQAPQAPRWVRVSGSGPSGRLGGRAIPSKGRACSGIRQNDLVAPHPGLATPSPPSQHLLPTALFSPATSSCTLGRNSPTPSARSDSSVHSTVQAESQGTVANHTRQVHDWGAHRTLGREVFQAGDTVMRIEEPPAEPSEMNQLSGSDSVQDAQRFLATVGSTSAFWSDFPEQVDSSVGAMWNNREELLSDENEFEVAERRRWQEWAKHAAEHERQRRMKVLESMDREEHRERLARRAWALSAMDDEQRRRGSQEFLLSIQDSSWFQGTISTVDLDYEVVCPYSSLGCRHICLRTELDKHLAEDCKFIKEPEDSDLTPLVDAGEYEVVCPNTILGCDHSCSRSSLAQHLESCRFTGPDVMEEKAARAKTKEMVLEQTEEERQRRVNQGDWQSGSLLHRLCTLQKKTALVILHKEILEFAARCRGIRERRKKSLETLWRRMEDVICLLWPDTLLIPYGSYASGMMTADSDIDMVVFAGDQRECKAPSPQAETVDSQPRRRGSRTDSTSGALSRIHELADHLQQHAIVSSMKVIDHARVPIIKAIMSSGADGDLSDDIEFNIDISIDGPAHSGLATSAFTSYLSDHLPNLAPLTIVLKSLLQSKGLNDPFTGGISSYGLTLMVAFALLQRDHFPSSPAGSGFAETAFIQQPSPDPTPPEAQADVEQPEETHPSSPSSQGNAIAENEVDGNGFDVPPSPVQADSLSLSLYASLQVGPGRKRERSSAGRQRFWQRSALEKDGSNGTWNARAARERHETRTPGGRSSMSSWDRPMQQHWIGSRTARAVLMQDFGCDSAAKRGQVARGRSITNLNGHHSSSPPPPPPPLPEPVAESVMAPLSPYLSTGERPVLGELLLDFLHLFGEDFDIGREGFSVRGGGFRFCVHGHPPHPQAGDPIVIEDPLNCMNNVGRSSFGIRQVQRALFEALTILEAKMVRVNQDGKEVLGSNTGILPHICSAMAATTRDTGS